MTWVKDLDWSRQTRSIIWMLYVGDHEDTDKWIIETQDGRPLEHDGSIRTVRKSANFEEHEMGGPVVLGSEAYYAI